MKLMQIKNYGSEKFTQHIFRLTLTDHKTSTRKNVRLSVSFQIPYFICTSYVVRLKNYIQQAVEVDFQHSELHSTVCHYFQLHHEQFLKIRNNDVERIANSLCKILRYPTIIQTNGTNMQISSFHQTQDIKVICLIYFFGRMFFVSCEHMVIYNHNIFQQKCNLLLHPS